MSPKEIINGIEMKFWQIIIPTFKKSNFFRKSFLFGYKGVQNYKMVSFGIQILICLLISLVVGLTIGIVINII